MSDNVEKFVNDMKKIIEFEKTYGKLEYTEQMNTGKLVLNAVERGLIKSTLDLVYICNELPELAFDICTYFDVYLFNKRKNHGIRRLRQTVAKEEKELQAERQKSR